MGKNETMPTELSHFLRKARKLVTSSFDPEMRSGWLSSCRSLDAAEWVKNNYGNFEEGRWIEC